MTNNTRTPGEEAARILAQDPEAAASAIVAQGELFAKTRRERDAAIKQVEDLRYSLGIVEEDKQSIAEALAGERSSWPCELADRVNDLVGAVGNAGMFARPCPHEDPEQDGYWLPRASWDAVTAAWRAGGRP